MNGVCANDDCAAIRGGGRFGGATRGTVEDGFVRDGHDVGIFGGEVFGGGAIYGGNFGIATGCFGGDGFGGWFDERHSVGEGFNRSGCSHYYDVVVPCMRSIKGLTAHGHGEVNLGDRESKKKRKRGSCGGRTGNRNNEQPTEAYGISQTTATVTLRP